MKTVSWVGVCLWLGVGCCSSDPALLRSPVAEERYEAFVCISDDAEDDLELRALIVEEAWTVLTEDPPAAPALRGAALRALYAYDRGEGGALLAVRLGGADASAREPNVRVRLELARALAPCRDEEAEAALRVGLEGDPSGDVRSACARELARRGQVTWETTEALVGGMRDPNRHVRLNARRALRQLHRIDLGLEVQLWEQWLTREAPAAEPVAPAPVFEDPVFDDPGFDDGTFDDGFYYEDEFYDDPGFDDDPDGEGAPELEDPARDGEEERP